MRYNDGMQDDNTAEPAKREAKKNSIPTSEIEQMTHGISRYEKTSFLVIGHKDGVRLAIPKTTGVSRAYFYGNGDYSLIPVLPAITTFTEEQRKEQRKGGIMAEVDFENLESARHAIEELVKVVRHAPAPEVKVTKPKAPKKVKAVPEKSELANELDASEPGDGDFKAEQLDV